MLSDPLFCRITREWNALKGKRRAIFWIACLPALIGLGVIFSSLGSDSYYGCSWLPFPMHTPVFFCFTWLLVHFLRGVVIAAPLTEAPLVDRGLAWRVIFLSGTSYLLSIGWFLRFFKTPSVFTATLLLLGASAASGRLLWLVARRSRLLAVLETPILIWLLCNLVATLKLLITEHL